MRHSLPYLDNLLWLYVGVKQWRADPKETMKLILIRSPQLLFYKIKSKKEKKT